MRINLLKIYNQLDPQWKDKRFGTSATIGQYGCLVSCIAMICQYYGKDETPASLVDKVRFSGNLWVWRELERIYPDIKWQGLVNTPDPLTKQQMDFIRERINEGYPVILQIDVIPSTSRLDEHWVLAVDYNGDDFMIVNPWGGTTHPITSYGEQPQRIIYAYTWYKGNPSQQAGNYYLGIDLNNIESVKECVKMWDNVMHKGLYLEKKVVEEQYIRKEEHQRIINEKEITIQNLNQQINQLNANLNQEKQEKEMLAEKVNECEKGMEKQKEEYNNLLKEVETLRSDKVEYGRFKTEWQLKEIEYQKRIKTLETKLEKFKSPMKKLLIEIWQKVAGV